MASFRELTPGSTRCVILDVAEGATLGEALNQLNIPPGCHAIAISQGLHLKRESKLIANQKIQVFPLVDGG